MSLRNNSKSKRAKTPLPKRRRELPLLALPSPGSLTTPEDEVVTIPTVAELQATHDVALPTLKNAIGVMKGLLGNMHYRLRLTSVVGLSTTAGGLFQQYVGIDPSTYDNWTQAAALFDEVRVLGGRAHYVGYDRYSKTVKTSGACVVAFDNDSTTASGLNDTDGWQYGTAKVFNLDDPFTYSFIRPNITPSAYWADVAGTQLPGGLLFLSDSGYSLSNTYGLIYMEIDTEFRSTR